MSDTVPVWMWACVAVCVLAAAYATWSHMKPAPHPHYGIRNFCAEHPDVCRRGSRMVRFTTPSPIPQQGYVEVRP